MSKAKKENNATVNTTANKEMNTMENTAIATATANNAITVNSALDERLAKLGYEALHTTDYTFDVEKDMDGNKVSVPVKAQETEKNAIDELQTFANIDSYKMPRQCALLAYLADKETYKEKGVAFKDYAFSIVHGKISAPTIQKYANIGKCFFKALDNTDSPLEWVDDRLATMNAGHGVAISNLDAILATFKAYADNTEIDGAKDYRDYVSSFIDEFCIDTDDRKARLHLEAVQTKLKDEVKALNGKTNNKSKGKGKDNDKGKDKDNDKLLNPFDGLQNALTRYRDSDNPNKDLLQRVNDMLTFIENMSETPEK